MDLGFNRWEQGDAASAGFAVLLVGIAARQAASPTARAQAQIERRRIPADRLRPRGGAFSASVAAALAFGTAGLADAHPAAAVETVTDRQGL